MEHDFDLRYASQHFPRCTCPKFPDASCSLKVACSWPSSGGVSAFVSVLCCGCHIFTSSAISHMQYNTRIIAIALLLEPDPVSTSTLNPLRSSCLSASECDFTGTDKQPEYQHTPNVLITSRRHSTLSIMANLWPHSMTTTPRPDE